MNVSTTILIVAGAVAASFLLATGAQAQSSYRQGPGADFTAMRSIGDVISAAQGQTVQILYVHGMRADNSGASRFLIQALLDSPLLDGATATAGIRLPILLGEKPAAAKVAGEAVWGSDPRSDEAWARSQPFVIHTRVSNGATTVLVTEINWWPLLMALRCKFLVVPDAALAGPHRKQLELCSLDQDSDGGKRDPYFPWIDKATADRLIASRPVLGGSAKANGYVKRNIFNWGLADAVIALGPMQDLLRRTMDEAAALALKEAPTASQRVLVAESLGSFVAMDSARDGAMKDFVQDSRDFYFLANQFALLELGRIQDLAAASPAKGVAPTATEPGASPLETLRQLTAASPNKAGLMGPRPAQVVAVNDPSDMLTYNVPLIDGITVSNLYWRFSGGPLKIFANPLKAHRGAIESERLWRVLLKPNLSQTSRSKTKRKAR